MHRTVLFDNRSSSTFNLSGLNNEFIGFRIIPVIVWLPGLEIGG